MRTSYSIFNGVPGVLIHVGSKPVTPLSIEVVDGRIWKIFEILNPDKVRGFA